MESFIKQSEIIGLLAGFKLGEIQEVQPLSTSGNLAFLIENTETIKYFLRLSPAPGPRWRSQEEILAEIELLEYLHAHDYPVKVPLQRNDGSSLIVWQGHFGYLREYVTGEEKTNPTLAEITEVGKILGKLHVLTSNFKSRYNREHCWNPQETKRKLQETKKEILGSNFANKDIFVAKLESSLNDIEIPCNLPSGIIHEDLGKRHVLWNMGRIASVIDFDRCYHAPFVLDLGQACRGWCFDDWKTWNDQKFSALIKGYESQRELTATERNCLADAIRFAILERALSFCLHFVFGQHDDADQEFAWRSISELMADFKANFDLKK